MFVSLASLKGSWRFKWKVCLLQRICRPLEGSMCQGPAITHPQCLASAITQISDSSVVHDLLERLESGKLNRSVYYLHILLHFLSFS